MKSFNEFLDIFQLELNEFKYIESHKELENFNILLQKYINIAELAYPKEFYQLLTASNQCPTTIEQIKERIKPLTQKYKIEISPKGVILEHKDKKRRFPLLDLKDFIFNYFYPKEDILYYLILGWLLQEDRFYAIQVFGVIMQMKQIPSEE